ncbi:hypothetical protein P7C71_g1735, partial [Lecanoromycetidae sp. Uapishka_2]
MHHSLTSSFIFTYLLASASAAPASRDIAYSKVHRQAILSTPKNGVIALAQTYEKYGVQKPDGLTAAATAERLAIPGPAVVNEKVATAYGKNTGETVATEVNDNIEFVVPVTVGGQTLNLNVDTGSSDLWVFNSALPAEDKQSNRSIYNSYGSKTFENMPGSTFGANYGDQSQTYGTVGTDVVVVGGLTVQKQAIGLPTAVSDSFQSDTWSDGVLGLGFESGSDIRPDKQPSFFENIMGTLQAPLFTANLKKGTAGNYQFGYIDSTAYSGELHYTPVNNTNGYWGFETIPGHSPAIADTGTSILYLDVDIVQNYWKQVPSHTSYPQGIIFPCTENLPDFSIQLGASYTATISGDLINYAPVTDPGYQGYCFGGIQANTGQGMNIFGDILFESQFVVFDYGNMRIGFAPHA